MTAEHQEGAHQGWNVKLRLAIDADNADEAVAIAAEVWRKMEVTAAAEPQITRSAGRAPHWNVITDLDLSALEPITPDDAVTRFRYVIRNLPKVVFTGPDRDDPRSGLWAMAPGQLGAGLAATGTGASSGPRGGNRDRSGNEKEQVPRIWRYAFRSAASGALSRKRHAYGRPSNQLSNDRRRRRQTLVDVSGRYVAAHGQDTKARAVDIIP